MDEQDDLDRRGKALELAYSQACSSYEAITDFRGKLLALLPLATGTGAFLLLERKEDGPQIQEILGPIGLLGLVVTMGLFAYELRGMQRCSRLEVQACTLEGCLGLSVAEGQFKGQPERSWCGMLGPPAAGLIIYLATAFTWFYIAGVGFSWSLSRSHTWRLLFAYLAVLIAAAGLVWWWLRRAATGVQTTADCHPRVRRRERPGGRVDSSLVGREWNIQTKKPSVKRHTVAPDGSNVRELLSVAGGGMAHFELEHNQTSVAVVHRTVDEIWYVLRGRGEMWLRLEDHEEIVEIGAGWCLTVPAGTEFQFRSLGYVPLSAIAATIPPWPGSGEATIVTGHWNPTVTPGPT